MELVDLSMRNRLDTSSVAQSLDGDRLKGSLQVPVVSKLNQAGCTPQDLVAGNCGAEQIQSERASLGKRLTCGTRMGQLERSNRVLPRRRRRLPLRRTRRPSR